MEFSCPEKPSDSPKKVIKSHQHSPWGSQPSWIEMLLFQNRKANEIFKKERENLYP